MAGSYRLAPKPGKRSGDRSSEHGDSTRQCRDVDVRLALHAARMWTPMKDQQHAKKVGVSVFVRSRLPGECAFACTRLTTQNDELGVLLRGSGREIRLCQYPIAKNTLMSFFRQRIMLICNKAPPFLELQSSPSSSHHAMCLKTCNRTSIPACDPPWRSPPHRHPPRPLQVRDAPRR